MAINQYEFPVDLPDSDRPDDERHLHALIWTSVVIVVATVLLALFNAGNLAEWATDLPPSETVATVVDQTDRWHQLTDGWSLGVARTQMHRGWKSLEAARWPGQDEPVETE